VLSSFDTVFEAREGLLTRAQEIVASGQTIFPKGDERGKNADIFDPLYPPERLNQSFDLVRTMPGYSSAKGIIAEAMHHYRDVDGNFIEQFQTTGFDSRLWELYLFAYLSEERLLINRSQNSPDFLVTDGTCTAAIEAVTVQPSQDRQAENISLKELTPDKIQELQRHYMPIKFGSPLYSKLKKRYWEKEHVVGKPLVLAIADFHAKQSMLWSSTALLNYLYGLHHEFDVSSDGQLIISPTKIDYHELNGKRIPSGFFFTEDAENVSAVMFSATGTIAKFIRIGKIAGFGEPSIRVYFRGTCYKHDVNAAIPDIFNFEVDELYRESWGTGISVYHNPNAILPLPRDIFPSVAHHYMQPNGQIKSYIPDFQPFSGLTVMLQPVDESTDKQVDSETC
jgi:hypothetical protein